MPKSLFKPNTRPLCERCSRPVKWNNFTRITPETLAMTEPRIEATPGYYHPKCFYLTAMSQKEVFKAVVKEAMRGKETQSQEAA